MARNSFLLGILVLLTGCATEHYEPKPLAPVQNAAALRARTLDDPGLQHFLASHGRDLRGWPTRHIDLQDLMLTALYESPELELARAQWRVAQGRIVTAGQRPNPSFGFSAETTPWALGLAFDIPVETAGKRHKRISQAEQLARAARLEVAAIAWQTRSRVRARYLDAFAAYQQQAMLQKELSTQTHLLKLLQQQLNAGEISRFELRTVRLQWQQTRLALDEARGRVATSRVALASATGLPASALEQTRLSFATFAQAPTLQSLPSPAIQRAALINRLDIRRSLAKYAAAEAGLRLEVARQYPDLHFGPGYSWNQPSNTWVLGFPKLILPVLNHNQGPIAEAHARRIRAAARFNALQALAIAQIDRALADYRASLKTLDTATTLLATQQAQQRALQAQLQAGSVDRMALVNAEVEVAVSARARMTALVNSQKALGALEDAVQQPLDGSAPMPPIPEQAHHIPDAKKGAS